MCRLIALTCFSGKNRGTLVSKWLWVPQIYSQVIGLPHVSSTKKGAEKIIPQRQNRFTLNLISPHSVALCCTKVPVPMGRGARAMDIDGSCLSSHAMDFLLRPGHPTMQEQRDHSHLGQTECKSPKSCPALQRNDSSVKVLYSWQPPSTTMAAVGTFSVSEGLFPVVQACEAPDGCLEGGNPQLVAVCILNVVRTLLATISSCRCLSPSCCVKAALIFLSTFFYFTCSISTDLGDLALLDEELPCSARLKVYTGSDSIFNYGWYQVFRRGSRNLLPMGSVCEMRDPAL